MNKHIHKVLDWLFIKENISWIFADIIILASYMIGGIEAPVLCGIMIIVSILLKIEKGVK